MGGWIKLHRGLLESPRYSKDSKWVHLWVHLLLNASHQDRKVLYGGKEIILQPGQLITGRKALARETGMSESSVTRRLKWLETEQRIEQATTTTSSLITICNWAKYQQTEQPIGQRADNERTTSGQRPNTYKKEEKEEKGETRVAPPLNPDLQRWVEVVRSSHECCRGLAVEKIAASLHVYHPGELTVEEVDEALGSFSRALGSSLQGHPYPLQKLESHLMFAADRKQKKNAPGWKGGAEAPFSLANHVFTPSNWEDKFNKTDRKPA